MEKFNETQLKNQNWKNIKKKNKYVEIAIESPDVISRDDTVSMIMRCDEAFENPSYVYCNDSDWSFLIRQKAGFINCSLIDNVNGKIFGYRKKINNKILQKWDAQIGEAKRYNNKLLKKWNARKTDRLVEGNIFDIALFGTYYINGPYSFVNYKTGKVGLIQYGGRGLEDLRYFDKELKWFAKTYPQYKFFITFIDEPEEDKKEVLCTLMLYQGKITRVEPRKLKQLKYLYRINHRKGATNKLFKYHWYLEPFYFLRKLYKNIRCKLSEYYKEIEYARCYWNYRNNSYFDLPMAYDVIEYWQDLLKKDK